MSPKRTMAQIKINGCIMLLMKSSSTCSLFTSSDRVIDLSSNVVEMIEKICSKVIVLTKIVV